MFKKKLFITPKKITFKGRFSYRVGIVDYHTYSDYNYIGNSFIQKMKRSHFEAVLNLTSNLFNKCNVIDFGCADGVFLPSISHYFKNVMAIDINENYLKIAQERSNAAKIKNVEFLCNKDIPLSVLKRKFKKIYHIIFILEVLEHVGLHGKNQYRTKFSFLRELKDLIHSNGLIVISVPIMVGIPFLLQYFGLKVFRMCRSEYQKMSFLDVMKASFLKDVRKFEALWEGDHIGFSHLTFEKYLRKDFQIVRKVSTLVNSIYLLRSK